VGDRWNNLEVAIAAINACNLTAIKNLSSVYETEPQLFAEQNLFLNCVCEIETSMRPGELLHFCKSVEVTLGRRTTFKYGPRVIDIDILLYDDLELATPELSIPHPLLTRRNFALAPLREVAPDIIVCGSGLEHWLDLCKDQAVTPIGKIEINA
jgi:2-amino-4-hydroxy-6-hydroxymethyldihydropteridine diphosphokinase